MGSSTRSRPEGFGKGDLTGLLGGVVRVVNEDGSFNLLVGATDIGTGADTMFCQLAAEALGVPVEKIIPYSSDTDMTPFDPGAYASSTTYISGRAVEKAARAVREQITADLAALPDSPDEKPAKVSLNDLIIKACAVALRLVPQTNAQFTPAKPPPTMTTSCCSSPVIPVSVRVSRVGQHRTAGRGTRSDDQPRARPARRVPVTRRRARSR